MIDTGALNRPDTLDLRASALFLDLDGTLARIASRPEDVAPNPARSKLLVDLGLRMNGRLAVISGRTIADVDRILDGAVTAVAGVHGLERRWSDGRIERPEPDAGLADVRRELAALTVGHPKLLIEDKGLAIAIHYRAEPPAAATVQTFAQSLAARTGLVVQNGEMVVELRGLGARKGDAINAFMHAAPFAGATPIFVGDDLTDEDGFSAVRALGGEGVLVGPVRSTAASRRLDDVDAVYAWLQAAISGGKA